MKIEKLKLNVIANPQKSSYSEDICKIAEFFDMLLDWHMEDQRILKEEKVSV